MIDIESYQEKYVKWLNFIWISTVQFVSISAFMNLIADPVIGGTYMTVSFNMIKIN